MPKRAASVLVALVASPPAQGTLRHASIQITVIADTAQVDARYQVTHGPGLLQLNAIRFPDQLLMRGDSGLAARWAWDTLPGLIRVTAPSARDTLTLELTYRVIGSLARIPLFVPALPTDPGTSTLEILVAGVSAARLGPRPFPRFAVSAPGVWLARPDHLPSFVALVGRPSPLPVPDIAEWTVVFLAAAATALWLAAQARSRRSGGGR